MTMKTQLTTMVIFCSCLVARGDLDIREITLANTEKLGWKILVDEEENYVRFRLQPSAVLLAEGRTAHLGVWQDDTLITSCILGLHKRREGDRYEFAVSKKYLTDSVFEIGRAPRNDDGESYRVYLRKIVSPQKKKARLK
jgi:hypothetical protein